MRKRKLLCGLLTAVLLCTSIDISVFATELAEPVQTEVVTVEEVTSEELTTEELLNEVIESEEASGSLDESTEEAALSEDSEEIDESIEEDEKVEVSEEENAEASNEVTYELLYKVDDAGNATITGYKGTASGDLIIPGEIDGYKVTKIAKKAFYQAVRFTGKLEIADSVISIGESAFAGSGFTGTLKLPNSITIISDGTFSGCNFVGELEMPEGVTTIGAYAFSGCNGFAGELEIPKGVTTIGEGAFYDCSGFTGELEIPEGVTSIEYGVFFGCSGLAGKLVIPDDVTTIGAYAFSGCNGFTGKWTMPKGVTSIGDNAFGGCSGFTGKWTMPKGVTSIGMGTFSGCSGFTGDLIIPEGVTSIGVSAFYECSGFTGRLEIPDSVTTIGNSAFYRCSGFTGDLIIPDSVTTIGAHAFTGCSGFTGALILPNSITVISDGTFSFCSGLTGNLAIPQGVTSIGESAFSTCSGFAGDLIIPDSVTTIGRLAFEGCSGLTGSLEIPRGLTTIGSYTFGNCGLTGNLVIPDSVVFIGYGAFINCDFTGDLVIPNGVTWIDEFAFSGCENLNGNVFIPESVETIEAAAFQYWVDTIYGVPGSYAETYARDNNITFISWNPNGPDDQEIYLDEESNIMNVFVVNDATNMPVTTAFVNGSEVTATTGYIMVFLSEDEIGEDYQFTVEADGYETLVTTRTAQKGGTYYFNLQESEGAVTAAKAVINGITTDLLSDRVYLGYTDSDLGSSAERLSLTVKGKSDITKYELIQDGETIDTSTDGTFSVGVKLQSGGNPLCNLKPNKAVYVRTTDSSGKTAVKKLGISIAAQNIAELEKSGGISIAEEVAMTLPNEIPLIGGGQIACAFPEDLPFELKIEANGHVEFAINKTAASMEAHKKEYKELESKVNWMRMADSAPKQSFGSGFFSAEVGVSGYGEGYVDMNNPGTYKIEANLVVFGKEEGSYKQYFMVPTPVSVPVYITVKGGLELKSGMSLSLVLGGETVDIGAGVGKIEGKIYLSPAAGVGIDDIASLEVAGKGALNYSWDTKESSKLWLEANLGLYVDVLGFTVTVYETPKEKGTWVLYPETDSASAEQINVLYSNSAVANLYNSASYQLMDRTYLNYKLDAQANGEADAGSGIVQSAVYPGAAPKMVSAGEKFYLFWLHDISIRSAENRAALVYATSEDGISWSEPKQLVDETVNQTLDGSYDLFVTDEKIYICWQDAAEIYEAGISLSEVAEKLHVSYAFIDISTGMVSESQTVTSEAGCYLLPQIGEKDGEVYISYVYNDMSEGDGLWHEDNSQYISIYNATNGKVINLGNVDRETIVSLEIAIGDNSSGLLYIGDQDRNLQTVDDRALYYDTRVIMEEGDQFCLSSAYGMVSNAVVAGGNYYWYENGNIYSASIGSTTGDALYDTVDMELPSRFEIASDGNNTALLWESIDEESEKVIINSIQKIGTADWTEPFALEETDSDQTSALSGEYKNGSLNLAYLHIAKQEDGSKIRSIYTGGIEPEIDISLDFAEYEYEDHEPGKVLPITAYITNKGNVEVNGINVYSDGTLLSPTKNITIGVGETTAVLLEDYVVAKNIAGCEEHCLTVSAPDETKLSDNDYIFEVGKAEVEVVCNQRLQKESTWLDISVLNNGKIATDCTLNIRADHTDGDILFTKELGTIEETKGISLTQSLSKYEDDYCTFYVEVVSSVKDAIEGNNIEFVYTGYGTEVQGGDLGEKPILYTVAFNSNGGSSVENQTVEEGKLATEPVSPTRDGYHFMGWYYNGAPYDFSTPVESDMTLEAQWKEYETLVSPSANLLSGSRAEAGTEIVLTCAADGAFIYYTLDETIPTTESTLYTEPIVIYEDTVIKAMAVKSGYKNSEVVTLSYDVIQGELDTYLVVFNSNGGSEVESQKVKENEKAERPQDPVWEGYRFLGWYLGDILYDFDTPVTTNLRLEAKWEELELLPMPVASIETGSKVSLGDSIILSHAMEGVSIYYTLNGTLPNKESYLYSEPVSVTDELLIIKAIAVKEGYRNSKPATFVYTLGEADDTPDEIMPDEPGDVLPEDMPEGGPEAVPEGLWIAGIDENGYDYTGNAIKPVVRVYDHKTLLVEKKDYTLSYKNNKKANDASNEKTAPTITVKGKGNYSGKETAIFKILPLDINGDTFDLDNMAVSYNRKKTQKPVPTLLWNGKKLKNKTDFKVTYPDDTEGVENGAYKEPGIYTIQVEGINNYTGIKTITLEITENSPISKVSVKKLKSQSYTGEEIKPEFVVMHGKKELTQDVDYTVSYEDNINVGTAYVVLTGINNYSGQKRVSFKITGWNIKNARVIEGLPKSVDYDGSEHTPECTLQIKIAGVDKTLVKDTDYTVSYSKNTDAGTASIIFTGKGGFTGTLKKTFKINKFKLAEDEEQLFVVEEGIMAYYAKGGSKPKPIVMFNGVILKEGVDYSLSYKNHKSVNDGSNPKKVPTITVKGKGNFTGNRNVSFEIWQQDISKLTMTVADKVYSTKKNGFKSTPKILDLDGKTLKSVTDYKKQLVYTYKEDTLLANGIQRYAGEIVDAKDIVPVDTIIQVTVYGDKNYGGELTGEYRILAKGMDIKNAKVTITPKYYTGKAITLDETDFEKVKLGKNYLNMTQFEIVEGSYKNNVKTGKASVTIRGIGEYGGVKTVTFRILPKWMKWFS